MSVEFSLESDMVQYAAEFARSLSIDASPKPVVVTLSGELGAGKSVFSRAVIRTLGFEGSVKSPTYTLVENYQAGPWRIAHIDLYRLVSGEELHYIGFEDIVANSDLLLIEWPERGEGELPEPTHRFRLEYTDSGRRLETL